MVGRVIRARSSVYRLTIFIERRREGRTTSRINSTSLRSININRNMRDYYLTILFSSRIIEIRAEGNNCDYIIAYYGTSNYYDRSYGGSIRGVLRSFGFGYRIARGLYFPSGLRSPLSLITTIMGILRNNYSSVRIIIYVRATNSTRARGIRTSRAILANSEIAIDRSVSSFASARANLSMGLSYRNLYERLLLEGI